MTSKIDMRSVCGCSFLYLSNGLVRVCEIELSPMGKINGNPDLVCEKYESYSDGFNKSQLIWPIQISNNYLNL